MRIVTYQTGVADQRLGVLAPDGEHVVDITAVAAGAITSSKAASAQSTRRGNTSRTPIPGHGTPSTR